MKLYSTTTSERASKGQGGNKKLVINLQIDPTERKEIGNLVMTCEDDIYTVYYYPINENCREQDINSGRVLLYQTKAKKKKADKEACKNCKSDKELVYNSEVMDNYCQICGTWQSE